MKKKYILTKEIFEINKKNKPEDFIGIVFYDIGLKNSYYKDLETFGTKEEALEALKNYKCTYKKTRSNVSWYWDFEAYYLEEHELNEDGEYETTDYIEFADVEHDDEED